MDTNYVGELLADGSYHLARDNNKKEGIELYEWFDSLITKESLEWKLATSSGTMTMKMPVGIFYQYTELPEHK